MKIILYLLGFIPLCLTNKSGVYFPKEEGLTVFTDQTYKEIIQHNDLIFLFHGAHWCDMCMRFLLKFEDSIKEIQPEFINILFGKVNGHNNEEVVQNLQLVGYPSYNLFYKGQHVERYHGNLQPNTIKTWLQEQLIPLGIKVTTSEEIEDKQKDNDAILVYFGNMEEDLSIISLVLFNHREIPLLIASNDLMETFHISTPRTLKMFKKHDEKEHELVIKSRLTKEEIEMFIKTYSYPLMMEYNKKAYYHIFRKNNPGLFLLESDKEPYDKTEILSLAKTYRGKLNVIVIDSIKTELGKEFANNYNITEKDLPTIKYFDLKYSSKPNEVIKPYDLSHLKTTIDKLLITIPKNVNEPVSTSVYNLTQNTFQKDVIDNDLDVFVKFYAPWCGHCKKLAPVYEGLAAKFASNPKIRIAELDATVHSIDQVIVKGYPTLILFPKGNKQNPLYYEGERKFEDMENFLKKNAGNLAKQDL